MLHVNGWHDVGGPSSVQALRILRDAPNQVSDFQGPTSHCAMTLCDLELQHRRAPDRQRRSAICRLFLAWFDHWLKDGPPPCSSGRIVQRSWRAPTGASFSSLPVAEARSTRFYLSSTAHAKRRGDGRLSPSGRRARTPRHRRLRDPRTPAPRGAAAASSLPVLDQRPSSPVLLLVYSTAPLAKGSPVVEVKGTVYVSSIGAHTTSR